MLSKELSPLTNDIDILLKILSFVNSGQKAAIVTVVETWGSAPRPAGSQMAISETGEFSGSISGGCVEGEAVTKALECIRKNKSMILNFSVLDEDARRVGLSCGGQIKITITYVSSDLFNILSEVITNIRDLNFTGMIIDTKDGSCRSLMNKEMSEITKYLSNGQSGFIRGITENKIFFRAYAPSIKLLIVGAVHIAQPLTILGCQAGYAVTLIDPRDNWATPERFPNITLDKRWPSKAINGFSPDLRTAIVTLSHDPKLDDPALVAALNSKAFYIGALGSKRTHQHRIERMKAAGFSEEQIKRIFAPIGLNIKAKTPFEIAISILGQIIEVNQERLIVS